MKTPRRGSVATSHRRSLPLMARESFIAMSPPRTSWSDPRRQAILLLGGDKSGAWREWYEWAVPAADDLYDEYLAELEAEGLI